MTTHLTRPAELLDLVGEQLGTTDWYQITYERVNLFADATGDYRRLPHPPPRTAAEFKNAVASGYLTLSLLPRALATCSPSTVHRRPSITGSTGFASPHPTEWERRSAAPAGSFPRSDSRPGSRPCSASPSSPRKQHHPSASPKPVIVYR